MAKRGRPPKKKAVPVESVSAADCSGSGSKDGLSAQEPEIEASKSLVCLGLPSQLAGWSRLAAVVTQNEAGSNVEGMPSQLAGCSRLAATVTQNEAGNVQDVDQSQSTEKTRAVRRSTLMTEIDLLRIKGIKLKVEFESMEKGARALGKIGSKYRSYLAVLARSKVPIDIPDWDHVPQDIKDNIWGSVLTVFNGVEHRKKEDMQTVGERWRDFKARLTTYYITKKTKGDESPLQKYPFIDPNVWKNFVASRQTPEFQALSQANRERQSKNVYKHNLSRGGYKTLEQALLKAKLAEASSSGSSAPSSSIEVPRHLIWKKARMNANGEYLTEESRIVAKRIDDLELQKSQGLFTPVGRNDILATALGKEEHPGRVRGVGGRVGIKEFFGSEKHPRGRWVSTEELQQLTTHIRTEIRAEMENVFDQKIMSYLQRFGIQPPNEPDIEVQMNPTTCPLNTEVSCPLIPDPTTEMVEGAKCNLAVEDHGEHRTVAIGRICGSRTLHGRELPGDQVRVAVDISVDDDATLPVPVGEMSIVHHALGSFIAWPKMLIVPVKEGIKRRRSKRSRVKRQ